MSGLTCGQLDELEIRVSELLEEPWVKGSGRPRELTLREALIVACGYERNNITEEIWAEIFRREPVHNLAVHHLPYSVNRSGDR